MRMATAGVLPGVPDWIIAEPWVIGDRAGSMVGIELKSARGRLTDGQREFLRGAEARGWLVATVRTMDEFIAVARHVRPMNGRTIIGGGHGGGVRIASGRW
jgi:hypothetical protein